MEKSKIHISGSEVASLLGLSKWDSPMDIYMRKLGLTDPKPESEQMRWGSAAEHVVARRYALQMGYNLYPSIDQGYDRHNPLIHPQHPWWTGTPDRKIYGPNDDWGLLEIKIIGERSAGYFGEPPDGEIPDEYMCQMAWYFPLIKAEWGDLAVQIGNREFRIYRIKRDRELENLMKDTALDFIENHLIPEIPPPIDGSESSRRYLNIKHPKETEPIIDVVDGDIAALAEQYRETKKILKNWESEVSGMENHLKEIIGDAAGIRGDWGKITWTRNKDSQKVDWEGLAKSFKPDQKMIDQFTTIKPGARVFRTKFSQED